MRKCTHASICSQKLFRIVLHTNINFLISKQNRRPKIDPKMLKQYAGTAFLDISCLLHKHKELYNQINKRLMNTSTAMNCIYSLPCFCSDSNNILNNLSCVVYNWFQHLYINSKDRLNCIYTPAAYLRWCVRCGCTPLRMLSGLFSNVKCPILPFIML